MEIKGNIFFIPGQDAFLPDSHVYVIGDMKTKDLTLIDAGIMGNGSYKINLLEKAGFQLEDIKRIILTHTHIDHMGCLAELRVKIPHLELWVHEEEALPLQRGDERTVYGMEAFRSLCQTQFHLKPGDFSFPVHRQLQGGEILDIGGMGWEVLHIPGHSLGSIALYNAYEKVLIPGDVIYADHAIGRFDLHGASGRTLRESLFRLAELDVDVLLPGHNRVARDLRPGYIGETAKEWESYLT